MGMSKQYIHSCGHAHRASQTICLNLCYAHACNTKKQHRYKKTKHNIGSASNECSLDFIAHSVTALLKALVTELLMCDPSIFTM